MPNTPSTDEVDELFDDEAAEGTPTARQMAVTREFLDGMPHLLIAKEELNASELDPREYFLVSQIDGTTTVETLLDIGGMPLEEALAVLDALVRRGIVGV